MFHVHAAAEALPSEQIASPLLGPFSMRNGTNCILVLQLLQMQKGEPQELLSSSSLHRMQLHSLSSISQAWPHSHAPLATGIVGSMADSRTRKPVQRLTSSPTPTLTCRCRNRSQGKAERDQGLEKEGKIEDWKWKNEGACRRFVWFVIEVGSNYIEVLRYYT